jgi:hypothetical protein
MAFIYESKKHRLIDTESGITITSRSTGVGLNWRRVFEFSGGGIVFCFFAKALDTSGTPIKLADHWSLDGTPRKSARELIEIDIDHETLAWAFNNIAQALPLFPEFTNKGGCETVNVVKFDLLGKGTRNPTL